jgi:hypothetical protein
MFLAHTQLLGVQNVRSAVSTWFLVDEVFSTCLLQGLLPFHTHPIIPPVQKL